MTLTTHALAGAAVATIFPAHPVAGFFAGFASHFVLDAIPHWDYKLASVHDGEGTRKTELIMGPDLWKDVMKVSFDALLGFVLALLLFGNGMSMAVAALAGAFGALFPDGL